MLFLLGSIIFTSFLTLWFKVLEKYQIPNFQAIVFNYLTCVATGSIVNGYFPLNAKAIEQGWFPWAGLMGFVFIFLFNIIGFTAQRIGVAVSSVANKLSLVIPFLFSLYLYNEKATWLKIAGIVVALAAVVLTCWPRKKHSSSPAGKSINPVLAISMPALLFVGSGMLDTMIKWVEQGYLNESNKNDYLITAFAFAAIIGSFLLIFLLLSGKQKFDSRAVLAGIGVGVPNYFSIWCLLKVLKNYGNNSSAIIPINNMGIVLFSTLVAWLLFKEKLSAINWIGVILSVGAIALIAYG